MTSVAGLTATGLTANLLPAWARASEGPEALFDWDRVRRSVPIHALRNPVTSAGPFHPPTSGLFGKPSAGTSRVWRSP